MVRSLHPSRVLQLVLCGLASCWCAEAEPPPAQPAPPTPRPTAPPQGAPMAAPSALQVFEAAKLGELNLTEVEALDLALSAGDRLGRLPASAPTEACDLDLEAVATRAPRLRRLRLSGCSPVGLQHLHGLTELELSDLELDASTMAAIGQLSRLERLTLVRVSLPAETRLEPLAAAPVQALALVDLQRDSELASMLKLWPRTLKRVQLVGDWAGHKAMLALAEATAVEQLELRQTRASNFSLNQVKPLLRLRHVIWAGGTFNDNSPLYFRDLPVRTFRCECAHFGDAGLHTLRTSEGLQRLELENTRVTQAGLAELRQLPELDTLTVPDLELGAQGLAHLAGVASLRRLEAAVAPDNPALTGLGALTQLERLRLTTPTVDDRGTAELSRLVNLRELDLSGTRVSDVSLAAVAHMPELRILNLARTRVTNRGFAELAGLRHLEYLDLDRTDTVDAAVAALVGLQRLRFLRLSHTLVTDAAIDDLLKLQGLQRLDLAGTVITPKGQARLGALPALVELVGPDPAKDR